MQPASAELNARASFSRANRSHSDIEPLLEIICSVSQQINACPMTLNYVLQRVGISAKS